MFNRHSEKGQGWAMFAMLLVVLLLIFSVRVVDQSEACIKVLFGRVTGVAQPGFQLVTPLTSVKCYPATAVMFQTGNEKNPKADYWDVAVEIKTSDGQTGYISFNILYRVDPTLTSKIYGTVAQNRSQLNERIVANFARSIPRDVASGYTADGLYATQRAAYAQDIRSQLEKIYAPYGVILVAFELRDVQFSEAYENAIEQQQIAEENIQTAQFVTEQKKQEAEQARIAAQGRADSAVIEAKAEAEALEVVAQALARNPQIVQYEYVKRLSPTIQTMLIPSGQQFILPLPTSAP